MTWRKARSSIARTGGALLVASVLAGWLWQAFGPEATFATGAALSGLTILVMLTALRTGIGRGA